MNKKKIKLSLLIILIFIIFSSKVSALTCSYNYTKDDYKLEENKVIYRVDELTFEIKDFDLEVIKQGFSTKSSSSKEFVKTNFDDVYDQFVSKLTIDDFVVGAEKTKQWKCPELYFLAEVDFGSGTHTYTISRDSSKGKKLNFITSTGENDLVETTLSNSDWVKVCRYGEYTLKISKTTFEFSHNDASINSTINSDSLEFGMDDIKKNSYECPRYICRGVDLDYSYSIRDEAPSSFSRLECYEAISITDGCVVYNELSNSYINNKDNNNFSKLRSYCSSKLANNNFDDDCVKACLKLNDMLKVPGVAVGKCGFSDKLILYIANIIKWVKYLIPVVVIVLGILDFIKAIASSKDDEMKKAQGHFVKRLIAAALIFIVPFIIEFVLDKMGFASNGCGIIDL